MPLYLLYANRSALLSVEIYINLFLLLIEVLSIIQEKDKEVKSTTLDDVIKHHNKNKIHYFNTGEIRTDYNRASKPRYLLLFDLCEM